MELTTMLYASCLQAANSFLDHGQAHQQHKPVTFAQPCWEVTWTENGG
jgi:hypothetical protein